ncbi:NACHT domain-containing protein [Amycolatopsis sp. CA-128772]|uniref:NACHT domain-containing protein n=1 Tax=Amycolatopsis sp. CA-128772 TaxID=2073159 RepID=UPI000CD0C29A|nr:NACHT domain-containing protein [Amycolatopsis sp. CA-128772]
MEQDRPPAVSNRVTGDAGTVAQFGAVYGVVNIHGSAPAPEPPVAPPRGWDDLPELPPEVRALLDAQVRTAEDLPYQLPGARRPSLAAVYVRQEVSSETDGGPAEPARPRPVLDGRGQRIDPPARPAPRLVVRPPSRTVRAALDDDDHLLVTGGPGQGKSTLSLRLAADIATRWAGPDGDPPLAEPVIPVRLPARELATRLALPFFRALAESIQAEYGALLDFPVEAGTLAKRVAGCRWLLLVDGLDEVADLGQRDRLIRVLVTRASQDASAHYRIVLTTRPIAGAALAPFHGAGAARYELLPFDEEALRHFAANWFAEGDTAERFVRQVHDANLDELVRVPLLATIAAIMFEQDSDRRLPDNRYELYESYLAYLQSARAIPPSPWDECRERLFRHLGCVRLEEETSLLAAAGDWAAGHAPHACGTPNWHDQLTTYLTAVGPFVSRAGELRFLHHSFAEHLAATAHALKLPDRFDPEAPEFVRLLHTARPGERGRHARLVLLHYTRLRQTETDRLIGHLHDGNPAMHVLAARLLAWHAPASPAVTDAFLATARKWAMTTQYPAQVILTQVSRAAHHPGLAEWLRDLMRAEGAPWESRIEAGRALAARLYGPDRVDAVAMLRSVVEDQAISVEFRFEAAKALAECGAGERAAAVSGLRSVLADPAATALQCRNAAIVLAGLGPEPRSRAIEALAALLDDPQAPEEDMVHAAMGLLELGAGYEARCVELFRAVLARQEGTTPPVRNAALGLASLGPDHLAEVVATLEAQVADQRPNRLRLSAARVLAELGPQHRLAAGEILLASAARPGMGASSRVSIAGTLGRFGPEFRERAVELLRAVSAGRPADTNALLWMADNFADLGPEHHAEAARELTRVAEHPHAAHFERTMALGKLADLGEPHRTAAVRALRRDLTDRGADPALRVEAGRELIRLGPAFHTEAARHLLEIAAGRAADPQLRMAAWRALQSFGTAFHHQASAALLELLGPGEAEAWEAHTSESDFYEDDTDPHAAAAALALILRDPRRGVRHRVAAAHSLVNLGRHHHALAVAGFAGLLARNEIPVDELDQAAGGFSGVSAARRAELAGIVAAGVTGRAPAGLVLETAEAMAALDVADPRIDAAVRALRSDAPAAGIHRAQAAMLVARRDRAEVPAALDAVLPLQHAISPRSWVGYVRELVALGADLPPAVRTNTTDADAGLWLRQLCAGLLCECRPELLPEALTELRSQADDTHLQFTWRTEAVMRLAELDPSTVDDAIAFHRQVLDDETEPVAHRGEAGNQLVRLDPGQRSAARSVLRRLAGSPERSDTERADALTWLTWSNPPPGELVPLARAIVHDPTSSPFVRQKAARFLPAAEFRAVSRAILADRTAPKVSWAETTEGYWDNWALANEAEAVLRDTLAGAETSPGDRIAAAAALGRLSPRLVPEAVALLTEGGGSGHLARQRLLALAELDPGWRERVLGDTRAALDDEGRAWRQRVEAAELLIELGPEPLTEADHLRLAPLLRDDRLADRFRIPLCSALRRFDDIRALRDDDRARTATRWMAAGWMRDYAREDRERGARVLAAIAGDPATRPALRRRAAGDLAMFGAHGRKLAADRLRTIMTDETLPILTRAHSARVLGDIRPDVRGEVLALLRRLQATAGPAVRFQVLDVIGRYEPEEAALALRAMAEDPALEPLVRLYCADRLVDLQRDHREPAALVCRELAHDETVPRHIRADAARGLAILSALCRQEARELLTEIQAGWGQARNRASAAAQSAVPEGS